MWGSSPSSSSRRAQAIRQWAVISGHESEPVPFSPLLLARKSRRYLEELVLGSGPGDIVIDSAFDRDSVVQFISACEGADFSLTLSNVFEIELLCDEWSVSGKSIRQKVIEFIEHPPSGQSLWLHRLLFRLGRGCPHRRQKICFAAIWLVWFVSLPPSIFRPRFCPESSISGHTKVNERNASDCLHFALNI
jgi:hypothetical protein